MNKKTRDDATEALLLDGDERNFVWFVDMVEGDALVLACDARAAAEDVLQADCATYSETSLEAAQLLLEGWVRGDKVVKL